MLSVALGADHAGWELKEALKSWLMEGGFQVLDFGTHSPDSVDYPDYAETVARHILANEADFGILVCKSGIGMSIAANRVRGVRAALVRVAQLRLERGDTVLDPLVVDRADGSSIVQRGEADGDGLHGVVPPAWMMP